MNISTILFQSLDIILPRVAVGPDWYFRRFMHTFVRPSVCTSRRKTLLILFFNDFRYRPQIDGAMHIYQGFSFAHAHSTSLYVHAIHAKSSSWVYYKLGHICRNSKHIWRTQNMMQNNPKISTREIKIRNVPNYVQKFLIKSWSVEAQHSVINTCEDSWDCTNIGDQCRIKIQC